MSNDYFKKYLKYKNKYMQSRDYVSEKIKEEMEQRIHNEDEYYKENADLNTDDRSNIVYSDENDIVEIADEDTFYISTDEPESVEMRITDSEKAISKDEKKMQQDLGLFGLVRGRQKRLSNFGEDDYTHVNAHNKDKILKLDTSDDFDNFTEEYGFLYKNNVFIRWHKVANNYKGILINLGLKETKYEDDIIFKGKSYQSWWKTEYNIDDNKIFIFEQPEYIKYNGKPISSPFSGKIYAENDLTQEEYTQSFSDILKNKILWIDNVENFDKFTNKYGFINKKNTIEIDWKKAKKDWKGFYLDKDSTVVIYEQRYRKAFFNDKKYKSWLRSRDIKLGIVYVF